MTALLAIMAVLVLAAVVVAVWLVTRRHEPDTLGVFQRQIDALSSEARRPVVNQVQQLEQAENESDDDRDDDAGGPRGS